MKTETTAKQAIEEKWRTNKPDTLVKMQERNIKPRQTPNNGGRRKGTIFHPTLGYPIQPPMPVTVQRRWGFESVFFPGYYPWAHTSCYCHHWSSILLKAWILWATSVWFLPSHLIPVLKEPTREEPGEDGERRLRMFATSCSFRSPLKEDVKGK